MVEYKTPSSKINTAEMVRDDLQVVPSARAEMSGAVVVPLGKVAAIPADLRASRAKAEQQSVALGA